MHYFHIGNRYLTSCKKNLILFRLLHSIFIKITKETPTIAGCKRFFKRKKTKNSKNQENNFTVVEKDIEQIDDSYLDKSISFFFIFIKCMSQNIGLSTCIFSL